ncbi:hypothetical protein OEZ85_011596 [Tetradesmus obliquus]|uniref:Uncharacterized protein n=1 Tax=Tetradesmus obliquus TaxID=3088 RepID=A0ABY8TSY2_TETOB|nr:hypothetical protein OEZ85_011596 [Tetradesmus obliquus]
MALYRGSSLVGLLLALVQLRVRPGGGWLRALLLRAQGKLRMLRFEELAQLCWCLAQLSVVPPQAWLDDFADTAALHVIAARKQQQQQQQQQRATASSTPTVAQPALSSAAASAGSGSSVEAVRNWQLRVMHFALVRCWRYRGSHTVGKLQYRLVRELNRWEPQRLASEDVKEQGLE